MANQWKNTPRRLLALLLCLAMILPVLPQAVRAETTGTGSVAATDEVLASNAENVTTGSPKISFTRAGGTGLYHNDMYLIMSDKYGYIMDYDPIRTTGASTTGSFALAPSSASWTPDYDYYIANDTVYLNHSDRNEAMWILRQYNHNSDLNRGAIGTSYEDFSNGAEADDANYAEPCFGGSNVFYNIELQKGTTNAAVTANCQKFWHATGSGSGEHRLLFYKNTSDSTVNYPFTNEMASEKDVQNKFMIEALDDDKYLIYYRGWAEGTGWYFRFLTCDANGTWSVVQYNGEGQFACAAAQNNLANLAVRLYHYEEQNAYKTVSFKGKKTYYAINGAATLDSLKSAIRENITVFDPDLNNMEIPYSESGAVGYYTLDLSGVNCKENGSYTVNVNYVNDDLTVKTIRSLTVNVAEADGFSSDVTGIISHNSHLDAVVYKANANGEATNEKVTFSVGGAVFDVTVSMLYADGKRLDPSEPKEYQDVQVKLGDVVIGTMDVIVANGTIAPHVPVYPADGSVKVDKFSTTDKAAFATSGLANIQLTATGLDSEKEIDLIIMMDLSSSMRFPAARYVSGTVKADEEICGPYLELDGTTNEGGYTNRLGDSKKAWTQATWEKTRMYELEQSLKALVDTLQESDAKVNIALADFGDLDHYDFDGATLESDDTNWARTWPHINTDGEYDWARSGNSYKELPNHLNYVMGKWDNGKSSTSRPYHIEHTKFWSKEACTTQTNQGVINAVDNVNLVYDYDLMCGRQKPKIYTGANVITDAFTPVVDLNMDTVTQDLRIQNAKLLGTNYDVGLEYVYKIAWERKQHNLANGQNREIVCIFMSDGAAMQYNYFSGHSNSQAWVDYLDSTPESLPNEYSMDLSTVSVSDLTLKNYASMHPVVQSLLTEMHKRKKECHLMAVSGAYYPACSCLSASGDTLFKCIGSKLTWYDILFMQASNGMQLSDYSGRSDYDSNNVRNFIVKYLTKVGDENTYTHTTYSPLNYFYHPEGKNWWAEAIKGSTDSLYPVINKYAEQGVSDLGEQNPSSYNGKVKNNYTGGYAENDPNKPAWSGKRYISGFQGLGVKLHTVGFALSKDYKITAETAASVLGRIATENSKDYVFTASNQEELTHAFTTVVENARLGGTKGYFVDKMGPNYDLAEVQTVTTENGQTVRVNPKPTIRLLNYDLVPVKDANGNITDYVRVKNADGTEKDPTVFEEITFNQTVKKYTLNSDGTVSSTNVTLKAKSSLVYTTVVASNGTEYKNYTDIWTDDLIRGAYVIYNTSKTTTHKIDTNKDNAADFDLEPETFYWIIGNIPEYQVVLEYQAYLSGSLEGTMPNMEKDYDTNTSAVLNYTDHLGNVNTKTTVSPKFPWGENPKTKYAFYLVNEKGEPITTSGTPTTLDGARVTDVIEHTITMGDGATTVTNIYTTGENGVYDDDDITLLYGLDKDLYKPYDATYTVTSQKDVQSHDASVTGSYAYIGNDSTTSLTGVSNATLAGNVVYFPIVLKTATTQYAFYRVNEFGKPVDKDGKEVLDFKDAEILTTPESVVVPHGVPTELKAFDLFPNSQLAGEYYLYGTDSTYDAKCTVNYNAATDLGSLQTSDTESTKTTYVTKPGDDLTVTTDDEYTNSEEAITDLSTDALNASVVYFAVVKKTTPVTQYNFYVVDEYGNPVDENGKSVDENGNPISFKDSYKPLLDKQEPTILLQSVVTGEGITTTPALKANELFPGSGISNTEYELYSKDASYTVTYDNTALTGSVQTSDATNKTYVTDPGDLSDANDDIYINDGTAVPGLLNPELKEAVVYFPIVKKTPVTTKYNYYLVNEDGDPVDDDGNPVSFENRVVIMDENGSIEIDDDNTETVKAADKFPEDKKDEYQLFNPNTEYTVTYNPDDRTSIVTPSDDWDPKTTYVIDPTDGSHTQEPVEGLKKPELEQAVVYFGVVKKTPPVTKFNFYVVDEDGNPLNANDEPVDFDDSLALLGKDVEYTITVDESKETTTVTLDKEKLLSESGLNVGEYQLFSDGATYTVEYNRNNRLSSLKTDDTHSTKTTQVTLVKTEQEDYSVSEEKIEDLKKSQLSESVVYIAVVKKSTPVTQFNYYLVDEDGNPINKDGKPVSFEQSEKIYDTHKTESINVDSDEPTVIGAQEKFTENDLFELYNPNAEYSVDYDGTNRLSTLISSDPLDPNDPDEKKTTYITNVTDPDADPYIKTDDPIQNLTKPELKDSVVYFAVKLKDLTTEDIIVIDYGIPVKIDVMGNDELPSGSTLTGISNMDTAPTNGTPTTEYNADSNPNGFAAEVPGVFGAIELDNGMVRYTLDEMDIDNKEVFVYVANAKGYNFYAPVTVIPATTIYYEEGFVDFQSYTITSRDSETGTFTYYENEPDNEWVDAVEFTSTATQEQDRPGLDEDNDADDLLDDLDADNIYGYDKAYKDCDTYSLGNAKVVTVNTDKFATATFSFWGTGFDVISLTSNTTGTIMVSVYPYGSTTATRNLMVDTYYGYSYVDGKWIVNKKADTALYQIPVMKVDMADDSGNGYGHYTVKITVSYASFLDHQKNGEYDFYLDAIRIYNPANEGVVGTDTTIKDYYAQDGEYAPTYTEVRNILLNDGDLDADESKTAIEGAVFIDGDGSVGLAQIADYKNYGPNNEVYLAKGQAIAFDLSYDETNIAAVHLGMKRLLNAGTVRITKLDAEGNVVGEAKEIELNSKTDLFYNLSGCQNHTVIIQNISTDADSVVSLTSFKTTHMVSVNLKNGFFISRISAANAVAYLNSNAEVIEPTLKLAYPTLSFEDVIRYDIFFTVDDLTSVEEMGLLTFNSKPENAAFENADHVTVGEVAEGELYLAQSNGIPAKNMGDELYLCAYAKLSDGSYAYSNVGSYSAVQYAQNMLAKEDTSSELKSLLVAMVNYGAAAQVKFGYNTDSLMNSFLTEEQKALVSDYSESMLAGVVAADASKTGSFAQTENFGKLYPSVTFGGAFSIDYFAEPVNTPDGDVTLYIWDTETYANADALTVDNATAVTMTGKGVYSGSVTGIAAKEIGDTYYAAAVYEVNGERICSGVKAYSLGAYCKNIAAKADSDMQALAQATAVYGSYAEAYFQ